MPQAKLLGFDFCFLLSSPARQDDRLESWNYQLPLKRP
jgi:hypothetical protein